MIRKGAASGTGRGYKNLRQFPTDSKVHRDSKYGIKQPQLLMSLKTARPINELITNLHNFERFKKGHYDEKFRETHNVYRVGSTIVKEFNDESRAKREKAVHNLLADNFDHPRATIKTHDGFFYLIRGFIKGRVYNGVIQDLPMKDKNELAEKTRFLYKKGYVDYDLRNRNVLVNDEVRLFDFDHVWKDMKPESLEMQYNLNIVSIFGRRSDAKNRFMTITPRQLGLVL